MLFGVERMVRDPLQARDARIGLVTNDAARLAGDAKLTSRRALRDAGFNLVRLFGPEHGIAASAADGAPVDDSIDPITGLPVVSLYGQAHRPRPEHLRDLDVVLFDIPDVGARFYTYIWTLSHVLEACADARIPLFVLDRPNPLGGDLRACEGPMLDEVRCCSFVGRWNIPIRYGLTIGELARLWNAERAIGADLRIIELEGWRRDMHWPDTGLPFVPTSPAMPDYQTALIYPGTCLFEGTNLSEGRGTDAPFRTIGAPWVKARQTADRFNALALPGLRVEPIDFTPAGRKYAGEVCHGVRFHIDHARVIRPVAAALHLVSVFIELHAEHWRWTPYPTAANATGGGHFDRLVGTSNVRESLQHDPKLPHQRIAQWTGPSNWQERTAAHLIYP